MRSRSVREYCGIVAACALAFVHAGSAFAAPSTPGVTLTRANTVQDRPAPAAAKPKEAGVCDVTTGALSNATQLAVLQYYGCMESAKDGCGDLVTLPFGNSLDICMFELCLAKESWHCFLDVAADPQVAADLLACEVVAPGPFPKFGREPLPWAHDTFAKLVCQGVNLADEVKAITQPIPR